jgi:hypothetical protein
MKGSQESLTTVVVKDAANWPTATATNRVRNEETLAKCAAFRKRNANQNTVPLYLEEVVLREEQHGQAAPANPSTDGSRQESWATPECKNHVGYQVDATGSMWPRLGSQVAQWATPNTMDCLPSRSYEAMKRQATNGQRKNRTKPGNLREQIDPLMCQAYKDAQAQANQWGTPTARDHKSGRGNEEREYKELTPMVERTQTGKLNPRWVETLMGLPVGWVMPSCASPVTIEQTNCASSATESCLQQPSELLEF